MSDPGDDLARRWARLERSARRPLGPGVAHPDACPTLPMAGVAWALPPAEAKVEVAFLDGRPRLAVMPDEKWPGAQALLDELPLAPVAPCPRCGQARAGAGGLGQARQAQGVLEQAAALARELVLRQYDLSDRDVGALLSYPVGQAPPWLEPLVAWCRQATGREVPLAAPPGRDLGDRLRPWIVWLARRMVDLLRRRR